MSGHLPGDPRGPESASKGSTQDPVEGPATILNDLCSPFSSGGHPQETTFGVLFSIFWYFRHFVGDSAPELFLEPFWNGSGTLRTLEISPNHCSVDENTVLPKSQKLAPDSDLDSILDIFSTHVSDISGHLGAKTTFFEGSVWQ